MCSLPPRSPLDAPLLLTGAVDQSVALWSAAADGVATRHDAEGAWRSGAAERDGSDGNGGGAGGAPSAWCATAAAGGSPAAVVDLPYELCPGVLSYVHTAAQGAPSLRRGAPLGAAHARAVAARASMAIVATALAVDDRGTVLAVGTNKGLVLLFSGDLHRTAAVAGDETKRSKLSALRTFDLTAQVSFVCSLSFHFVRILLNLTRFPYHVI